MRKFLSAILVITATILVVGRMTTALFSDTETSTSNIFEAGAIDLLINGENDTEALVSISDLKPGDDWYVDKNLFINSNPAYVWLHITDLVATQGAQTEPEELEEAENGEQSNIHDFLTYDLTIDRGQGPEVLVDFEDENLLPEMVSCWIPLGEIPGLTNIILTQSFHFDELVTNWAQGDVLSFVEEYYAEQVRNNPNPDPPPSDEGRLWNPDTRSCEDCETEEVWADSVEEENQALRQNGTPVLPERSDPTDALGIPDGVGNPASGFFSLGFGGDITVKFAGPVYDRDGDDLSIHEITNGRANYPLEKAQVQVSQDGIVWFTLAEEATSQTSEGGPGVTLLDISASGFPWILYVKVVDTSNPGIHNSTADAFDLDAIDAKHGNCSQDI